MNNQQLSVIATILIIILLSMVIRPILKRRQAVKTIQTVLLQWQNRDQVKAMSQWENPAKYPPVYNLLNYEFTKKEFLKIDGVEYAKIFVELFFDEGSILPNNEEWLFVLKYTSFGWKVNRFILPSKQIDYEKILREYSLLNKGKVENSEKNLEISVPSYKPPKNVIKPKPLSPPKGVPSKTESRPGYKVIPAYIPE